MPAAGLGVVAGQCVRGDRPWCWVGLKSPSGTAGSDILSWSSLGHTAWARIVGGPDSTP